jgi:hypothetical protein
MFVFWDVGTGLSGRGEVAVTERSDWCVWGYLAAPSCWLIKVRSEWKLTDCCIVHRKFVHSRSLGAVKLNDLRFPSSNLPVSVSISSKSWLRSDGSSASGIQEKFKECTERGPE